MLSCLKTQNKSSKPEEINISIYALFSNMCHCNDKSPVYKRTNKHTQNYTLVSQPYEKNKE